MDISSIDSDKVYSNYMNNLLTLKMKILSTKDEEIKKKYNEQYNEALINSIKNIYFLSSKKKETTYTVVPTK